MVAPPTPMTKGPIMPASLLIRDADSILAAPGTVLNGPLDILITDGRIARIAPGIAASPGIETISAAGHLVAPGLVNAHWHSPMQLSHGTADRMNHRLFMWENQVDTARRSAEEAFVSASIGCLQMLRTGTTAVIDHYPEQGFSPDDVGVAVDTFEQCGIRAVVALRIFDMPYDDILPPPDQRGAALNAALAAGNPLAPRPLDETLAIVRESIARYDRRAGRIRVFPAPSNPVRCSDALLVAAHDIAAAHDTGVHCHMLETEAQVRIAQARWGTSVIAHLAEIGAWSGRWSNAHCNWVSERDIALLAEHHAVAVLNPESNLKIGSGIPPIPRLLAAGAICALGTDGASTNDNLVLQDAMQLAAILHRAGEADRQRWVRVEDVLAMATTGGAAAMLEPDLGTIRVGSKADLALYDLDDPVWVPLNDPAQQLVFGERGGAVRTVIVDGRLVLRDGRAVSIDEAAVIAAARDMLRHARARNEDVRAIAEAVAALG